MSDESEREPWDTDSYREIREQMRPISKKLRAMWDAGKRWTCPLCGHQFIAFPRLPEPAMCCYCEEDANEASK